MKKGLIALGFILLFLFSFLTPQTALAGCVDPGTANQCPKGYVGCFTGSIKKCCSVSDGGCSQLPNSVQQTPKPSESNNSLDPTTGCTNGINTAIGCISVLGDQNVFLAEILRWAVGVGGGIAFLLIVYAGFIIATSSGNPERLKAGQELMTSAISGIVLMVLSIFVLRVIGVDILKIPGFN